MSVALRGNLSDFGIAEVFQLIGQQRKTGLLDVTHDGQTMRLAFDAGAVVWGRPVGETDDAVIGERLVRSGLLTKERLDALRSGSEVSARSVTSLAIDARDFSAADAAQVEDLVTNETVFIVLRWSEGTFDFSTQAVRHEKPADKLLAAEQILMDGLRMVDEWQTFAPLVPDGDTVFERSQPLTSYKRDASGEARRRLPAVERVYGLVDGRLTAQRIIDLSRLGLFDATRALSELRKAEVIAPLSSAKARVRRLDTGAGLRTVATRITSALAAVVPLLLLGGIVAWLGTGEAPAPDARVFPIVRAPLADARDHFELRRLRHALEAQHLLSGRWPEDLSGRDETGLLGGGALTRAEDAPYYYARRGNGIVLLAPERREER
jgi:hypothetical protein